MWKTWNQNSVLVTITLLKKYYADSQLFHTPSLSVLTEHRAFRLVRRDIPPAALFVSLRHVPRWAGVPFVIPPAPCTLHRDVRPWFNVKAGLEFYFEFLHTNIKTFYFVYILDELEFNTFFVYLFVSGFCEFFFSRFWMFLKNVLSGCLLKIY